VDRAAYEELKAQARNRRGNDEDPLTSSLAATTATPFSIRTSFAGLDRRTASNHGYFFYPPDPIVAKGPDKVLEATNSAARLFTSAGAVVDTKDLNTFFATPIDEGLLFDPKVYFDRNSPIRRYYMVVLQTGPSLSRIWLAISRSASPADLSPAAWCRYALEGRWNVGTVRESEADYPGLGVGADAVVISTNQRQFFGDFTYAVVRTFNKIAAANNGFRCPPLHVFSFQASTRVADLSAFTLQPVQHYSNPASFTGTTNPIYLVSSMFGRSTRYNVWRIRNVASGAPTLQGPVGVSGTYTYDIPPDAGQAGSQLPLETGDTRITQAAGMGSRISAAHGTLCNMGGGTNESCVRVVRFVVAQDGAGEFAAVLDQQATLGGGAGVFYFWPAVAVNALHQTALVFHRSSTASYLSTFWTTKEAASPEFAPPSPLTLGTCAQTRSDRTGDYLGAQTDPSEDFRSFWVAGARATTINGICQWQTWIGKIALP
jgi:hypothetical protein